MAERLGILALVYTIDAKFNVRTLSFLISLG